MRNLRVRLAVGSAVVLAAALGTSAPATADPGGSGHVYQCHTVSMTNDYYTIAFSQIHTCSLGPADGPSYISELSTYTGQQTGRIDGHCAWHAYYRKGWHDSTRIWNWCLTDPSFVDS